VGVTALILSQAVLNAFAVLGLAPLTGVPLPFVSYGSSSLIVMLAGMGLLLNVASGATGHVRAVAEPRSRSRARAAPAPGSRDMGRRESEGWAGAPSAEEDRDRRRRDRGTRRAGAGGRGSAAG
ncbi:MAG TPA: FtsW/RodA/SpoVE family cell cycle protein, partial [Solirubrobacteraceae bacterium]